MQKKDPEVETKLKDAAVARSVSRKKKHGRAGFHSSEKGDKGYNRKPKHKEECAGEE